MRSEWMKGLLYGQYCKEWGESLGLSGEALVKYLYQTYYCCDIDCLVSDPWMVGFSEYIEHYKEKLS